MSRPSWAVTFPKTRPTIERALHLVVTQLTTEDVYTVVFSGLKWKMQWMTWQLTQYILMGKWGFLKPECFKYSYTQDGSGCLGLESCQARQHEPCHLQGRVCLCLHKKAKTVNLTLFFLLLAVWLTSWYLIILYMWDVPKNPKHACVWLKSVLGE